jgi:hypothetical protein
MVATFPQDRFGVTIEVTTWNGGILRRSGRSSRSFSGSFTTLRLFTHCRCKPEEQHS